MYLISGLYILNPTHTNNTKVPMMMKEWVENDQALDIQEYKGQNTEDFM